MSKLLKSLAILSLLGFPMSALLYRLNLIEFTSSFKIITYTLVFAIIVFFLSIILGFVYRKDSKKTKSAIVAALIALIPIVGLGIQANKGKSLPYIHNISTDINNPPAFDKIVSLRIAEHNPHQYQGDQIVDKEANLTLAQLQQNAYPEVKTYISDLSLIEAHVKAKSTAESMGWELVNSNADDGIIEATHTSLIWGFKDDVVVRLVDQNGKTAVDVHSVSRIGGSDLGANAKRITTFLKKFKS